MTVHFIYAVPRAGSHSLLHLYSRLSAGLKSVPPLYRSGINNLIDWPQPINAPYSITYNILNALKKKYRVKLYDLREKGTIKVNKQDIILAHPLPDFSSSPAIQPDKSTLAYRAIMDNPDNKSIIITPYNHDVRQVGWLREFFEKRENVRFIAICGTYWMKTWEMSPFKDILQKNRVMQVNMAINSRQYPLTKTRFSQKGKRKFLYIGRTDYPKNTVALENIAMTCKGFEGGFIGSGNIKGWKKISDFSHLNPELIKKLTEEFDFFLSTSEADAQATTVLEQMCIGLGVATTHESGYDYPSLVRLDKEDIEFNCAQIAKIQQMEEEEIKLMTSGNRAIAEQEHNWEKFTEQVLEFIQL